MTDEPWRKDDRWNAALAGALAAARARPTWIYSKEFLKLALIEQPTEVWIAADIGLGVGVREYGAGDTPVVAVEWTPWRDVFGVTLHARSELRAEGDVYDELRLTIKHPAVNVTEHGKSGIALSDFAAAVFRGVNGSTRSV
jgi:hypothetical protein